MRSYECTNNHKSEIPTIIKYMYMFIYSGTSDSDVVSHKLSRNGLS